MPWTIHCHYCGQPASWRVTNPTRSEVACDGHLEKSKQWVGAGAAVEAVQQPGAAVQEQLFDLEDSPKDGRDG